MSIHRFTKAFSITELLVVITIISFLAVAAVGSYDAYRTKARDTQRVAALEQIHLALKQYESVNETLTTCADTGYAGGCDQSPLGSYYGDGADTSLDGQFVEFLITAGYLSGEVLDPLNDSTYFYAYGAGGEFPSGSGNVYDIFLITFLEDDTNPILQEDINDVTGIENAYVIADNL